MKNKINEDVSNHEINHIFVNSLKLEWHTAGCTCICKREKNRVVFFFSMFSRHQSSHQSNIGCQPCVEKECKRGNNFNHLHEFQKKYICIVCVVNILFARITPRWNPSNALTAAAKKVKHTANRGKWLRSWESEKKKKQQKAKNIGTVQHTVPWHVSNAMLVLCMPICVAHITINYDAIESKW